MRLSFVIVAILGLLALTAHADSNPASLKVFAHQRGVQRIADLINPLLLFALNQITIPDQDESPGLGIHLYLRNIKVSSVAYTEEDIIYTSPNVLTLTLKGVGATFNMDWQYKDALLINFKGSAVDTLSDTTITIRVVFGADQQGHPQMDIDSIDVNIGNLDIDLSGDGHAVFNVIAKIAKGIFIKVLPGIIQNNLRGTINGAIQKALAAFPTSIKLSDFTSLSTTLLTNGNLRGMSGSHYSNNHFGGSTSAAYYYDQLSGRISLGAYESIDIQGYIQVPTSGQYQFQIYHNQRGQLDVNGASIGSLETWNIGMCWVATNTETTQPMTLDAHDFIPIRLRYQSGCGGGYVEVRLCNAAGCQGLPTLNVYSQASSEVSVSVYPNYILGAFGADFKIASGVTNTLPHVVLPNNLDSNTMLSIAVDEYLLNSYLWAATKEGNFTRSLYDKDLPANFPLHLNTGALQLIFPDLYNKYPNASIGLHIQPVDLNAPTISFSADNGITLAAQIGLALNVVNPDNTEINAITLEADVSATAAIGVNVNNSITGTVKDIILNLVVDAVNPDVFDKETMQQTIGTVLQPFINDMMTSVVIPILNGILEGGIPIPQLGPIVLSSTSVEVLDRALFIHTDFDFKFF